MITNREVISYDILFSVFYLLLKQISIESIYIPVSSTQFLMIGERELMQAF